LTALIATWPLAAQLKSAIPLGTDPEATVPLFTLWTLWWTADRAAHGFAAYWDAPFFHPVRGTLAFSEPQILTGLMVAPLWATPATPALIYNLAFLAFLTLNGIFAYRLARSLAIRRLPALLGGVLAVNLPFVAKVHGVLPLIPIFGMLWALEGLVRFKTNPSRGHAAWAAAGFLVQFLVSEQMALLFAPLAAAAGLLSVIRQPFLVRPCLRLAVAALLALLVGRVAVYPAQKVREQAGLARSETVVRALSASPRDFLIRPATALLPFPRRAEPMDGDTAGLFPGVMLSMLAVVGIACGIRLRSQRAWTLLFVGGIVMGTVAALGLNLVIGGLQPFATLRALVPAIAQLRSPYRFAVVAQACLLPLAALALASMEKLLSYTGGRTLVTCVPLLAAAENLSIPEALRSVPPTPATAWTSWLRVRPTSVVIAHIPFPAGMHVSFYEVEAWRLFAQMHHEKRMVNGYSSFFPPAYTNLQLAMARDFPNRLLLCTLMSAYRANTLVVDQNWIHEHEPVLNAVVARGLMQPIYADGDVRIYSLVPDAACIEFDTRSGG